MIIHWCLKGIAETSSFGDGAAAHLLKEGLFSRWVWNNHRVQLCAGLLHGQAALGPVALDNHVNNYASVPDTPYISLSAGIVTPAPSGGVSVRPAWKTALDFATRGGQTPGYVIRCWTVVSPKRDAGLFAISDEVRDLNIFRQFWIFHDEGEIAVPLIVPARQIEWVAKFDAGLNLDTTFGVNGYADNPDFVPPDAISNVVEVV